MVFGEGFSAVWAERKVPARRRGKAKARRRERSGRSKIVMSCDLEERFSLFLYRMFWTISETVAIAKNADPDAIRCEIWFSRERTVRFWNCPRGGRFYGRDN